MDLYDVMTITFASRDFTDEPLPDDTLFKILDRARFAPSGGNRQAWKVIVTTPVRMVVELSGLRHGAGDSQCRAGTPSARLGLVRVASGIKVPRVS
jgi:hypothetical protein